MSFNSLPLLNNQYGSFNYLLNGNFDRLATFTAQVTGAQNWNAYKDAAATTPVDGTGGSPTIINNAVVSSGVLRGIRSWTVTKTGNAQGEGYSTDFTIDTADTSRALLINFDYSAGSAYVASDLAVYIYDITNSTLITPTITGIPAGNGNFAAQFASTTSTSYRLIVHCATSSATTSNWSMTLDNFRVTNLIPAVGTPVTDWISFTPTIVGLGTVSNMFAFWKRIGDLVQIRGSFTCGTTTGVASTISLPSGLNIDSTKIPGDQTAFLGTYYRAAGGSGIPGVSVGAFPFTAIVGTSTTVVYLSQSTNSATPGFQSALGTAVANSTDRIMFDFSVPVSQWSASANFASTNTEFAYNTDTTNADNTTSFGYGSTGVLVPNRTVGTQVSKTVRFQQPPQPTDVIVLEIQQGGITNPRWEPWDYVRGPAIYQGASIYGVSVLPVSGTLTDFTVTFNAQGWRSNNATYAGNGSGFDGLFSNGDMWRLRKSSGVTATQVAQGGSVRAAAYRTSSNQTFTAGSDNEYIANTKRYDTHSAYSTSTGRFTAPVQGTYLVNVTMNLINGGTAPSLVQVFFKKNNTGDFLGTAILEQGLTASKEYTITTSCVVNLGVGDFVSGFVKPTTQNITSDNTGGTNDVCMISFVLLGYGG